MTAVASAAVVAAFAAAATVVVAVAAGAVVAVAAGVAMVSVPCFEVTAGAAAGGCGRMVA